MIGVGSFRISEKARVYINQVLDSERLGNNSKRMIGKVYDSNKVIWILRYDYID